MLRRCAMHDETLVLYSSNPALAEGRTETGSVLRIALLLIAKHGTDASEVARGCAEQAAAEGEAVERQLWRWVIAAVENLLDALLPTDLLYATAFAAPAGGTIAARAA